MHSNFLFFFGKINLPIPFSYLILCCFKCPRANNFNVPGKMRKVPYQCFIIVCTINWNENQSKKRTVVRWAAGRNTHFPLPRGRGSDGLDHLPERTTSLMLSIFSLRLPLIPTRTVQPGLPTSTTPWWMDVYCFFFSITKVMTITVAMTTPPTMSPMMAPLFEPTSSAKNTLKTSQGKQL